MGGDPYELEFEEVVSKRERAWFVMRRQLRRLRKRRQYEMRQRRKARLAGDMV